MQDGRSEGSADFDHVSRVYDLSRREAYPEVVEKLVASLVAEENSRLLDLGCGTGNYVLALASRTGHVVGIDISSGMIQRARTKVKVVGSPLALGDVTRLPFRTGTFDGAFAIQVIHHIQGKGSFLREAYRVLRRSGSIAIDSCSHEQLRIHWFYHYFPRGLEIDLNRIPDTDEIISLLERAGFSDITMEKCYSDMVVTDETPESYLAKGYRDGISTFSLLTDAEIEAGCEKIREDIYSGKAHKFVGRSRAEMRTRLGGSTIISGKKN